MAAATDKDSSLARIQSVHLGRANGVFGLHVRLAFANSQVVDYALTEMQEIEQLMDGFRVATLQDLVNKKMRVRNYAAG